MINLIPSEEKKNIRKDFYIRLVIVALFVVSIALLIVNIMLTPSLFYASLQKNLITDNLNNKKDTLTVDLDENSNTIVSSLEEKIRIINSNHNSKFVVSERIINNILRHQKEGINFTSFSYEVDPNKNKTLQVKGSSASREQLLVLKKELEKDASFEKLDLPISNFIKSRDIDFNLTLIPYEKK